MVNKHEQEFDPSRPALVLVYGNWSKKHRMLDRDVILVGRARGCDLGLDAPDISSIHCVIHRGPKGFHVRDCQSRAGTKLNGNNVRESPLKDGDLLQIGPFSFRANLPGACGAGSAELNKARLEHVRRSRRNLARIALRQRKMLRLQDVLTNSGTAGKNGKGNLGKQVSDLKDRIREQDQRAKVLDNGERELKNEAPSSSRRSTTSTPRSSSSNKNSSSVNAMPKTS